MTIPLWNKYFSPQAVADRLMWKQYKLDKKERGQLLAFGLFLTFVAGCIASSIYFWGTQFHYVQQYQDHGVTKSLVNVNMKHWWDNFPLYLQNALYLPMRQLHSPWIPTWTANAGTAPRPGWWLVSSHDFRYVLISFIMFSLIGALRIGLKRNAKQVSHWTEFLWRPLAALVSAGVITGGLAAFFALGPIANWFNHHGLFTGVPYLGDFFGVGHIQLLIIGSAASLAAKFWLNPVFRTVQLWSIERNIAQLDNPNVGRKRFYYLPNYKNRYRWEVKQGNKGELRNQWLGMLITLSAPLMTAAFAFGLWLKYFGPAKGA